MALRDFTLQNFMIWCLGATVSAGAAAMVVVPKLVAPEPVPATAATLAPAVDPAPQVASTPPAAPTPTPTPLPAAPPQAVAQAPAMPLPALRPPPKRQHPQTNRQEPVRQVASSAKPVARLRPVPAAVPVAMPAQPLPVWPDYAVTPPPIRTYVYVPRYRPYAYYPGY